MAVESFYWKQAEDYYLIVSELVPYKRIDIAVRLFSKNGRRLRVVGQGPEHGALKAMAAPNVEFCGRVSDKELREIYACSRALLLPGEEDFGMTPVEALASGKPVVALGRGGVVESVPQSDPVGGVFFDTPDEEHLAAAIQRLERLEPDIEPRRLQASVSTFSEEAFEQSMRDVLFTTSAT